MEDHRLRIATAIFTYATLKDLDLPLLCTRAGIDLAGIEQQRPGTVSATQLEALWQQAALLSRDPLFGLHLGESLQPAALGLVGQVVKTSATVGEAVTQAATLAHLFTDLFALQVEQDSAAFMLCFLPEGDTGSFTFRHTMDLFMAFAVHEMDGLLLEKITPDAVYYPLPIDTQHVAEYARVLRCSPLAKKDTWAIRLPLRYWNKPVITADYAVQQLLLQKAGPLSLPDMARRSFPARIYFHLLSNAYLGIASQREVAANFNISSRSLQRRLQRDGVQFQDLADKARKAMALHYMGNGQYPVKEIAYLLGYNEVSAFTRAFKRWTGVSPQQYGLKKLYRS